MPDLAELYANVTAQPDDDTPRLVLADHLQQLGDPRGELIVLQCALASGDIERRVDKLLAEHHATWAAELGLERRDARFVRGFVEALDVPWTDLARADELATRTPLVSLTLTNYSRTEVSAAFIDDLVTRARPWLRTLRLRQVQLDHHTDRLVSAPGLANLRSLELSDVELSKLAQRGFGALALPHLQELTLTSLSAGDDLMTSLAGAPGLAAVSRHSLNHNHITDRGLSSLAASPHAANLSVLHLAINQLGRDSATSIARSRHLAGLTTLTLASNDGVQLRTPPPRGVMFNPPMPGTSGPSDATLAELVASLPALRDLDLSRLNVGPLTLKALIQAPCLPHLERLRLDDTRLGKHAALLTDLMSRALRRLDLDSTGLGDDGAIALACSAFLRRVEILGLRDNGIADRGARELAESITRVIELDLSRNAIMAYGARALATARVEHLHSLDLSHNLLGDDGAFALRELPPSLRRLALDECGIGPSGAIALAAGSPTAIESLSLSNNSIDDAGVRALLDSPRFPCLRWLSLHGNPISPAAMELVKARHG